MDYLATNLATKPRKRKTTVYISPEVYELMCDAPGTISTQVNYNFLVVGAQQRKLPGVGPRDTEVFLSHLRAEDVVPQWQRMSYHDREEIRQERRRAVGRARPLTPEEKAEREREKAEREQEVFGCFREVYGSELVEQTRELELEEYSFLRGEFSSAFAENIDDNTPPLPSIEDNTPRVQYFLKPLKVKDLSTKSEKLSRLVALAMLHCPSVLNGVAARSEGRTLGAVERELELLVEMYSPAPQTAAKRRFWRNSS